MSATSAKLAYLLLLLVPHESGVVKDCCSLAFRPLSVLGTRWVAVALGEPRKQGRGRKVGSLAAPDLR